MDPLRLGAALPGVKYADSENGLDGARVEDRQTLTAQWSAAEPLWGKAPCSTRAP
jgi:hypothetical protein